MRTKGAQTVAMSHEVLELTIYNHIYIYITIDGIAAHVSFTGMKHDQMTSQITWRTVQASCHCDLRFRCMGCPEKDSTCRHKSPWGCWWLELIRWWLISWSAHHLLKNREIKAVWFNFMLSPHCCETHSETGFQSVLASSHQRPWQKTWRIVQDMSRTASTHRGFTT